MYWAAQTAQLLQVTCSHSPCWAVWWCVVATDTWSSTALGLPRAIQPRYDIPMPMDERVFAALEPTEPPVPQQALPGSELSASLIAQMIKLNAILFDINTFNTKAVSGMLEEASVRESVAGLSAALDSWRSELPTDMQYTDDNLVYWANHGCGPSFVVLHINFNHSSQLLFYRFLHNSLTPDQPSSTTTQTSAYAAKCKAHAASLCEVIYQAAQNPATEVLYPLVGHMLVIASTVHLYMLLFSTDEDEIALAKARLEHNFQIISRLQKYWPSLHASFSRLDTFHKACLDESKDGTFRLDRWMLRFLLDFAKPVSGREGSDTDDFESIGRIRQY